MRGSALSGRPFERKETLMSRFSSSMDAPLAFPIKVVPSATGPVPSLDDVKEDIHTGKRFRVREFLVAREGETNVLASPFYLEAGGTVIDWWPVRRARKRKRD
jgi:hypothetical protein